MFIGRTMISCLFFFFIQTSLSASLINITAEHYLAQNEREDRKIIVDFLTKQFDEINPSSVDPRALDTLWNDNSSRKTQNLGRFQIINQKLYADCMCNIDCATSRFNVIVNYFNYLACNYTLHDMDFIVVLQDQINESAASDESLHNLNFTPFFMFSKNTHKRIEQKKPLLPDIYMIDPWWIDVFNKIKNTKNMFSWADKKEKIFWRGSATGADLLGGYNLENYAKLPRMSLVSLARSYPDLLDAKFTNTAEFTNDNSSKKLLSAMNILSEGSVKYVQPVDHLNNKYLISIDGNSCAWQRVPWIMASNSVLVKQETPFIQYFYPAIKPYVHYVPVNERLTNIFAQRDWMIAHDQEVQNISLNAQEFIENNLTPLDIEIHTVLALNSYSRLQKDYHITPSLPSYAECKKKLVDLSHIHRNQSERYLYPLFFISLSLAVSLVIIFMQQSKGKLQ
jgi:hypothetical protein